MFIQSKHEAISFSWLQAESNDYFLRCLVNLLFITSQLSIFVHLGLAP